MKLRHQANQEVIELQEDIGRTHGRARAEIRSRGHTTELAARVASMIGDRLSEILDEPEKQRRGPARPYGTGERRGSYSR